MVARRQGERNVPAITYRYSMISCETPQAVRHTLRDSGRNARENAEHEPVEILGAFSPTGDRPAPSSRRHAPRAPASQDPERSRRAAHDRARLVARLTVRRHSRTG